MKPSEITVEYIKDYLRIDDLDTSAAEIVDKELKAMLEAAKQYAESYTGLSMTAETGERSLDDYDDVSFAILAIVGDLYESRTAALDKQSYQNRTVECILSMHSYNLV